ncbi:hypothetical protein CR513_32682, partial [Mucuna pruriens]
MKIVEHVFVKVRDIFIPYDFVVLGIEEDDNISIIIGRLFLAIVDVNVIVKKGKLSLVVGENTVEFELFIVNNLHFVENFFCSIDSLNQVSDMLSTLARKAPYKHACQGGNLTFLLTSIDWGTFRSLSNRGKKKEELKCDLTWKSVENKEEKVLEKLGNNPHIISVASFTSAGNHSVKVAYGQNLPHLSCGESHNHETVQ